MIVEDDITIARLIAERLTAWDYQVVICEEFKNVFACFEREEPHLLLLDIGLPFYNGFYWCQKVRQQSSIPIIFISSATDSLNIVTAINQGADDFIEKPFEMDVLIAKIRAQLRRAYNLTMQSMTFNYGHLKLDLGQMTLSTDTQCIQLTKNELKILQVLLDKRSNVISRSELMHALWDSDCFIDDNTLTVNVTRLRKKMAEIDLAKLIKTKKGMGYYIE